VKPFAATFGALIFAATASSALAAETGKAQLQKVPALRETQVNGAQGESAHGVAIWNPQDKSKARVIGAQPQGELDIYDINGVILQRLGVRAPRAVDVRNHFTWIESDGAILAATDNSDRSIVFYKLDPKTGLADPKSRGRIRTKIKEMSAVCLSQSGADFVMVAAGKAGDVHAWTLALDPWRDVTGIKIAETQFPSEISSCAIDDKTGALYLTETARGIWRVDAADIKGQRTLVDSVQSEGGRLSYAVNAVSTYAGDGYGVVMASYGPDAKIAVYDRGPKNHYRVSVNVTGGKGVDAVKGGLGLAAAAGNFGADAPLGIVVVQDSDNTRPKRAPNFKFVSFADVEKRIPFE
jgi:3-phytase